MCIILDASVAGEMFGAPRGECAIPIFEWMGREGKIVYGGKLAREFCKNASAKRWLLQQVKAARAIKVNDNVLQHEEENIRSKELCKSNDIHVVALARVSGARTLYTHDCALMSDFKNKGLIDEPRGRIYCKSSHKHLLAHTPSCGVE